MFNTDEFTWNGRRWRKGPNGMFYAVSGVAVMCPSCRELHGALEVCGATEQTLVDLMMGDQAVGHA